MRKATFLLVMVSFVPLAGAQVPDRPSGQAKVIDIHVSVDVSEARVVIKTSVPPSRAGIVSTYPYTLLLDLPGITYGRSARRIVVNQNGIQDIRIWQQQQNPPLTRISIGLQKSFPYALVNESSGFVLRIGSAVSGESLLVSTRGSEVEPAAAPAGRPSGAAKAAESIVGLFRHPPKDKSTNSRSAQSPEPGSATGLNSSTNNSEAPTLLRSARGNETKINLSNGKGSSTTPLPPSKATNGAVGKTGEDEIPTISDSGQLADADSSGTARSSAQSEAITAKEAQVGGGPLAQSGIQNAPPAVQTANANLRTVFHVKFVQQNVAYIDGGTSSGLSVGMRLVVRDPGSTSNSNGQGNSNVAELVVVGVAETSAVGEIHTPKRDVVRGDVAILSPEDTQELVQQSALGATRKYPAVISFTEGADALDQEARAEVPHPPPPSVNRALGRIGLDYMGTKSLDGSQFSSRDVGIVFRADFTRIGGTYWNLSGYWHGRINSISSGPQTTLQDLINRTYHLSLSYDNPTGHWVAGVGRLYVPWASSLETIDGGYLGRRIHPGLIAGIFAGSTPDPTSWNYNPNLRMGGVFFNFEAGTFDALHYSSTTGVGAHFLKWHLDRPFIFFENSIEYRHKLSVYHSLQADRPSGNPAVAAPGAGVGRSFLTVRWTPVRRLQLDANHTYFRDIPLFDPTLIGTGLLDKYLFQGFSGGGRVEILRQISLYAELGRSNRTGDAKASLNEMYGISFGNIPLLNLRADAHYSKFDSSFGKGSYRALSFTRTMGDRLQVNVLAGNQTFTSTLAGNQNATFLTATGETSLGALFFLQGGFTVYRGQLQSYDQWMFTLGYRFDSKGSRR